MKKVLKVFVGFVIIYAIGVTISYLCTLESSYEKQLRVAKEKMLEEQSAEQDKQYQQDLYNAGFNVANPYNNNSTDKKTKDYKKKLGQGIMDGTIKIKWDFDE